MKSMIQKTIVCIGLLFFSGSAQNTDSLPDKQAIAELKGSIDGIHEHLTEIKSTVQKLMKIKISGYIQAQARYAYNSDIVLSQNVPYTVGDFSGGAFGSYKKGMFHIRRGRLKFIYEQPMSSYLLQLDCKETGVAIKDVYAFFKEPWLQSFGLKAGVFDKPFGYEVSFSSGSLQSPERARLIQTLFPGEMDLGIMLDYSPSDNIPGIAKYLTMKCAGVNGNGIAPENENNIDFCGRLGFTIPVFSANFCLDGGFSGYAGSVLNTNDTTCEIVDKKMVKKTGLKHHNFDRQYIGTDFQLYYDIPTLGGICLRSEIIGGIQPGSVKTNGTFPTPSTDKLVSRNFVGYYGMCVKNIGDNSQLLLKYDVYDPNTDISGADITKSSGLTIYDIAYKTFGFGIMYLWDENISFTLYMDKITNEKIGNADPSTSSDSTLKYYTDDLNDDVLTLRIQYRF